MRTHVKDGASYYARIGIAGKQGAGKNVAGEFLHRQAGYSVYGFATPLYELLYLLNPEVRVEGYDYPWSVQTAVDKFGWDSLKRGKSPETRMWLQNLGSGMRKTVGEDVFIREAERRLAACQMSVICDVRHVNEVEWIKNSGGIVVWIDNCKVGPGINSSHESETQNIRELADIEVRNDGTLEEFWDRLEERLLPVVAWRSK